LLTSFSQDRLSDQCAKAALAAAGIYKVQAGSLLTRVRSQCCNSARLCHEFRQGTFRVSAYRARFQGGLPRWKCGSAPGPGPMVAPIPPTRTQIPRLPRNIDDEAPNTGSWRDVAFARNLRLPSIGSIGVSGPRALRGHLIGFSGSGLMPGRQKADPGCIGQSDRVPAATGCKRIRTSLDLATKIP